jgi:TetR/AcrR family transcriptional regulator, lmrAB and yxaGH operons repressor
VARVAQERNALLPQLADVFREHGFEGASLSLISAKTGLGKGSLYHFFPGGKEEMAALVLDDIARWFDINLFTPLRTGGDPGAAIVAMFDAVDAYFYSGGRVCLIGVFALGDVRDRFAEKIRGYFAAWQDALAEALCRAGKERLDAADLAEETIWGIQGALVAARALNDPALFSRGLARIERRLVLHDAGPTARGH